MNNYYVTNNLHLTHTANIFGRYNDSHFRDEDL